MTTPTVPDSGRHVMMSPRQVTFFRRDAAVIKLFTEAEWRRFAVDVQNCVLPEDSPFWLYLTVANYLLGTRKQGALVLRPDGTLTTFTVQAVGLSVSNYPPSYWAWEIER